MLSDLRTTRPDLADPRPPIPFPPGIPSFDQQKVMALSLLPRQVFSPYYTPYGICTVSSRGHFSPTFLSGLWNTQGSRPHWKTPCFGQHRPGGGSRHPDGPHPYRWTLGTARHFLGGALTLVYFTYHIANIQRHFEIFVHPTILQGQKHSVYKNTKRDEHIKQRIHRQFRNAFPNIFPS